MRSPEVQPAAPAASTVSLGGLLGRALDASRRGRLAHFITDEHSPAIRLFSPELVENNSEGDWYGEHAGKWLYAAAKAARGAGDSELAASVCRVADYLVSRQAADGYLGTYAPAYRFMVKQPPAPRSWDGAPTRRTWDIWSHACMIQGLLEVHKHFPKADYLAAAAKIGDLCWATLSAGAIDITELGLHHGLSATILLEGAVELYFATRVQKYLDLAALILTQADRRPELELLKRSLAGVDASEISTGKAYQLCWNMVGLAKLYKASGDAGYLRAVQHIWTSIRQHHLTLGGGPWGGVGLRSREVFNPASVFSPQGYVETCSVFAWIQLNRELLSITGEARYAEEIECAAYNDLLGAAAPNGEDWCYYSFPNGKRVFTTYWRCCKSSGAMALEELPELAYSARAGRQAVVNIYGASRASLAVAEVGRVDLEQSTDYPFSGDISIAVTPEQAARFSLKLRIPSWAEGARIEINGSASDAAAAPGSYAILDRTWQAGDEVRLRLPMAARTQRQVARSVQNSRAPDGAPIEQEVMHYDYLAITRGPLVYATGLIDGFKMEETLRLSDGAGGARLELVDPPAGFEGPAIRLNLGYRPALLFHPYYEAGGRADGCWRLTWMQVTPDSLSASP